MQVLDYTEGLEGEEAVTTAEEADAQPVQEVWQTFCNHASDDAT